MSDKTQPSLDSLFLSPPLKPLEDTHLVELFDATSAQNTTQKRKTETSTNVAGYIGLHRVTS